MDRRETDAPRLDAEMLSAPGRVALSRTQVHAVLCHAFVLNVPRGSALDFLGGGPDPLYVSGASLAQPKLLCLLSYLHTYSGGGAASVADDDPKLSLHGRGNEEEQVEFVRAAVESVDQLRAVGQRPLQLDECSHDDKASHEKGLHDGGSYAGEGALVTLLRSGSELYESGEDATVAADALIFSSVSGRPFGGGPPQGGSATEEECMLLVYTEALLGLTLFATPAAPGEVLLVRGVRRYALCSGPPHALCYKGLAPAGHRLITLMSLDASRRNRRRRNRRAIGYLSITSETAGHVAEPFVGETTEAKRSGDTIRT